jgi:hypothetical protein
LRKIADGSKFGDSGESDFVRCFPNWDGNEIRDNGERPVCPPVF